jgi:alpha/beta superfamily hydrolase
VDINVPQQDWVVFPDPLTSGSDDVMRITVSRYHTMKTDFSLVRVQYRRTDGDGAWNHR